MKRKNNQKLGRFYNSRRDGYLTEKEVFYETLATQIEREDQLVNIRLGWMLTTQALLFAAFAIVGGKDVDPEIYKLMRTLMPGMGIGIAFVSLLGVLGAHEALRKLKKQWRKYYPIFDKWPYMRPFGNRCASILGFMPSVCFPLIFMIVWYIMYAELPLSINVSQTEAVPIEASPAVSDTIGHSLQPDTIAQRSRPFTGPRK